MLQVDFVLRKKPEVATEFLWAGFAMVTRDFNEDEFKDEALSKLLV